MKAVIMAGGFGTRIHPLTINLPKPMLPFFNRPIIQHIIELLKRHGITELVLLLYHQPTMIKNYFRDGSDFGVHITYVTPLADFGTAGAVKAAQAHLDERFLIISGDLLTNFNLGDIISRHEQKGAQASITLTRVPDPLQFGVVITDPQEQIVKFLEKPGWGEVFSDTINTGIYVLEPEVLDLIPEGENRDWSQDVFPHMLKKQMALFGLLAEGYWQDIGNPEAYLEACRDVFSGKTSLCFDEPHTESDNGGEHELFLGKEASLDENVQCEGMLLLGENSRIHPGVQLHNVVVGRNCVIEPGSILENAILWDNVYLRQDAKVSGAVLGHNVRVGRGATVEPGAVVSDDTRVGEEALVRENVLIWPRKEIEAGATVNGNLIWGEKWRKSIFEGAEVSGLTNVELTPEFAARLGAACGSALPKDSYVLAGRDAFRASRMLKRSFVGGLLSTGVHVHDCKRVPLPVMRYKLTSFGEVGGIFFRQSPDDPATTEILFLDSEGIEASTGMTKSIERIFFKENFRRAHYAEPGRLEEMYHLHDFYREAFRKAIDAEVLGATRPKVVIDLNHSPAAELLPPLLLELGCEVIELNGHVDERSATLEPEQSRHALVQLGRIVVTLEADLGVWLGPSGERLTLVDDSGEPLDDLEALDLFVALSGRDHPSAGQLVVPVATPSTVDELASRCGWQVHRTRHAHRNLLESAQERTTRMVATLDGRFAFPPFQPNFDALFACARLLELMALAKVRLSELREGLPKRGYIHLRLPCPWEMKGGLMRHISEEAADKEASFIDGVRIEHQDGWVLVFPDEHRPQMHVIAEALSDDEARQLAESYRDKLEAWKPSQST